MIAFGCPSRPAGRCPSRCVGGSLCQCAASFTYFGEVLHCPHKRIVTITKVYIARNNIHLEIIRFHFQISDFSDIWNFEVNIYFRSLLPVMSRHWSIARRMLRKIVISGHFISGQAWFGTEQLHYFKLLCTGSSHGKASTSANSALIRYYLLRLKLSSSTRDSEWTNVWCRLHLHNTVKHHIH